MQSILIKLSPTVYSDLSIEKFVYILYVLVTRKTFVEWSCKRARKSLREVLACRVSFVEILCKVTLSRARFRAL